MKALGDFGDPRLAGAADRHEMGRVRRHLGGPDDALVVVVGLDDTGEGPPQADAVRAHDDGVGLPILAEERRAGGHGKVRSQLEDVADLDPLPQDQRLAAGGARVAGAGIDEVDDLVRGEVPAHVDVAVVEPLAVRAGDEVR